MKNNQHTIANGLKRLLSKFVTIVSIFILLHTLMPYSPQAHAVTTGDLECIVNKTCYYDPTVDCSSLGSNGNINAVASGKVYMIGDSIAAGSANELTNALKQQGFSTVMINAVHSRSLTNNSPSLNGIGVLQGDKVNWADASTIVVELGTNSSGLNPDNINKTISIIKQGNPNARIFWVNVGVDNSKRSSPLPADSLNASIQSTASAGYTVIDWASQVKQHPDYIDPGKNGLGVHPIGAGKVAFASTVAAGAAGASSQSSSGESSGQNCACSSGTANLVGNDNAQKIWNFLTGKGFSPIAAAGIMGNLKKESGFNPRRVQGTPTPSGDRDTMTIDGHTGYGLAQWTSKGRQENLHKLAVSKGAVDGDLGVQLEFLFQESSGLLQKLNSLTDIREATLLFHSEVEKSGDGAGGLDQRVQFANDTLASFGSNPSGVGAPVGQATGCATPGAAAGNISQTALNYSWPDHSHGKTLTAAYAAALQQYAPHAGNRAWDCSLFTGIVMVASGADPNYPNSSTGEQEKYVRSHPEKYDVVDSVQSISDLQPGDILIVNKGNGSGADGHTYIFVGNQPDEQHNKADASQGSRAPGLGKAILSDNRGNYIRARLK